MTQPAGEQIFRLPDVGEGLTEAEIVRWLVAEGDQVVVNQPLVEIETAKALVELPSPYEGTVATLHAAEGVMLAVGEPLITIAAEAASAAPAAASGQPIGQAEAQPDEGAAEQVGIPAQQPAQRESVLVGYGVDPQVATRRRHRRPAATPQGTETPEPGPPGEAAKPVRVGGLEVGRTTEARLTDPQAPGHGPPLAKPPVRKLAKQLGVDLSVVDPTGPGGVVTRADVERVANQRIGSTDTARSRDDTPPGPGAPSRPMVPAGVERASDRLVPLRGVARSMAEAMVASAFTAPHVSTWLDLDVTEASAYLDRLRRRYPEHKWSPTVLALAALRQAARRFPRLNATVDASGDVVREYADIRLGMAVATERGLLVAAVAGDSLVELAASVRDVTERARVGSLGVAELTGTTISLTNVGVFGLDGGTPILPPGQAAILCLGRVVRRPWVVDDQVVPRDVVTLALSFDHRCIDGELAGRALTAIAAYVGDPAVALAER